MLFSSSIGFRVIREWLAEKEFRPFDYQLEAWELISNGSCGLVNAPTGYGKTFSVFLGALIQYINEHPTEYRSKAPNCLQLLWISPLRALAKDIGRAMEEVISELGMPWKVGIRNGDTPTAERQRQKRQSPEILIITPESLHLLLAQKGYPVLFRSLRLLAVDEWHELIGSKRGVLVELAISRLVALQQPGLPALSIFGISATIGNLEQAKEVLLAPTGKTGKTVSARLPKKTEIISILPDEIEKYPWSGHLGLKLVDKIIPIIEASTTTLLFINTRGMSERWYQAILDVAPHLAGAIALHHGSIEQDLRIWVEEALHAGTLKCVVCTASLDLGVDFRPVETVIQVGSPKGVARFMQRAGRSGHQPGATSKIYFLPTHSLELMEAAALKEAISQEFIESREPFLLCFDVLLQYLCTLAISEGFEPAQTFAEIQNTFCFRYITKEEWQQVLQFLVHGGNALQQYDDYKKVEVLDGLYRITSRRMAMRHRMHIGTIVSDAMLKVKFVSGGYVGVIEEWFISRLEPGECFTLAGRNLELVMIKDMTVLVRKSTSKKSTVPSWNGGRMPLSSNLGSMLRQTFNEAGQSDQLEVQVLQPLFDLQNQLSSVPTASELLIEQIETKDGFHLYVFPFEGRLVHEAMAAILAYRISKIRPISFSFAMNDYGFELLSDQPIPVDDTNVYELFSTDNLFADIQRSVNSTEMAKRKFRDIAVIGGLIFQGYPGEHKKARHLQSSASLLFKVFQEYDPDNLLMRQAYQEVFDQQMEETRLRQMLERIQQSRIVLTYPEKLTPFCFPIKVDSKRESLSSESLEDRVRKMQLQLLK
ncbi:ligase-associated DNA damage response DEXH box helicase [Flavihumibacter sp. CACIAM 22H1]|uniref:ligase-associated DNA damage response DEXH box helicase n=1 Tax=Flavihumibacter sp. CACIAM 22H1 TaxID=1812911 RepID=UPI000A49C07E|nr:ligase-associated DNA damage response DEXH box helicase [Flavihumibacter sp. CACIAM 22H1]